MEPTILFIEPFYGGSHKQLITTLTQALKEESEIVTLPAKKWPWRARCSVLLLSQMIPKENSYTTLFCSSVLSLAELLGVRSDLQKLWKVIYFHENQLIYPKQETKQRDFQFGYNQITSCLSADAVVFNSYYNMSSFLDNINKFLKLMPDCRPVNLRAQIESKCKVLYFPINFSLISNSTSTKDYNKPLHIIWPHRWEFDKGPKEFFDIIFKLKESGASFTLSVLGETFTDVPDVFYEAKEILQENILHWGFVESKEEYFKILNMAHVVLSTAKHEFFGVAVLEATYCGCFPLVPNSLVYPEIYDKQCLYKNSTEAVKILHDFCKDRRKVQENLQSLSINFSKYSSEVLIPEYLKLLQPNT